MKNTTHKVVILENFSSPYIHQAIIILKNHTNGSEEKILFEAEKIVSNYIDRNADSDIKIYKKPQGLIPAVLNICLLTKHIK